MEFIELAAERKVLVVASRLELSYRCFLMIKQEAFSSLHYRIHNRFCVYGIKKKMKYLMNFMS